MAGFDPNATGTGTGGLITSSTPAPMVGPVAVGKNRPNTSATYTTATQADLIAKYGKMSVADRKALAAKLKAAGFTVPITGAYNEKVRTAYLDAQAALSDEINLLKANDPSRLATTAYDLDTYLANIAGSGGAGSGGPYTTKQTTLTNKTSAAKTLDAIAAELLGRQLSKEEKAKYTSMLNAAQKAAPTVTNVTPGAGSSSSYSTTGGLDTEQFLIEKLAGTDEAKAQKVLNAYEAVNKLFGGLQ